jgi:hypothetical protein
VAEHRTWDGAQLGRFLELIQGESFEAALMLAATTGMRRGDVLGLRWRDVDFDDRSLPITQTITTAKNQIVFGRPKTPTARRNLPLDPDTLAGLRPHRRRQAAQRQQAGAVWNADLDLVFPDETGRPLHPDRLRTAFERIVRRSDLPTIRFHDLRHSYATLALKTGVHTKVVSERLGHATVAITLDLYSHVTPGIDADAANVVADLVFRDRPDDGLNPGASTSSNATPPTTRPHRCQRSSSSTICRTGPFNLGEPDDYRVPDGAITANRDWRRRRRRDRTAPTWPLGPLRRGTPHARRRRGLHWSR